MLYYVMLYYLISSHVTSYHWAYCIVSYDMRLSPVRQEDLLLQARPRLPLAVKRVVHLHGVIIISSISIISITIIISIITITIIIVTTINC